MIPPSEPTDEELVARYLDSASSRRHREQAFRGLVERYESQVYRVCYRQLGNHADAQDAAQNAFVAVARKADQFRATSAFSTWLYRIAVNACHDLVRYEARRPHTPVEDVARAGGTRHEELADPVAGRALATDVERALMRLDPLSRTIVVLCAVEGHPYAEVAATLDMAVGTVKSRVFRARAKLAELLDEEAGADLPPAGRPGARTRSRGPPAVGPTEQEPRR